MTRLALAVFAVAACAQPAQRAAAPAAPAAPERPLVSLLADKIPAWQLASAQTRSNLALI
jgi:hypothetical protein